MPGFIVSQNSGGRITNSAQYHRAHRWVIEDLGKPSATGTVGGTRTRSRTSGPPERLHAHSVQLPSLVLDEEKIESGSAINYKVAKKAEWQDVVVKFYDVYGLFEILEEWQRIIYNPQTGIGRPDRYKGKFKVSLTDYKGDSVVTYTAHGAYPKSITHGDLTYTSSDIKLLTVTYSYDYASVEFNSAPAQTRTR